MGGGRVGGRGKGVGEVGGRGGREGLGETGHDSEENRRRIGREVWRGV